MVASVAEFVDLVLHGFYQAMHALPKDNYDALRFSADGIDRSNVFDIGERKMFLTWFMVNHDKLYRTFNLFGDNESKTLYFHLILFRLLGHLHVKLPTNNPAHWEARAATEREVRRRPSRFQYTGVLGPLENFALEFEGRAVTLDCWIHNIIWTFFIRQYSLRRGAAEIAAEPGDCVIDGGACFGDTGIMFSSLVGPSGKVYLFDFVKQHLDVIDENLRQNPELAERMQVLPIALGAEDRVGLMGPLETPSLMPGATLSNAPSVPVRSLDSLVASGEIERVDFIKLDVEGSEIPVLLGARETLRRFKPKLAISVYHKPNDFFEIPLLIESMGLGYQLYFDHYTIHHEESVVFARAA